MYQLCIILLLVIIIGISYYIINRKKIEQNIEENYLQKNREKLQQQLYNEKKIIEDNLLLQIASTKNELASAQRQLHQERDRLDNLIKNGEETIAQLEKRKKEQLSAIEEIVSEKKKHVDKDVEAYRELEMQKARTAINADTEANQKWAEASLSAYWDGLAQSTQETEELLQAVKAELEDYRKKQQAINEAILRQRAIDEQQDFYRVCLSENAIEDIKLLQEIRQKLHTSDNLNKLIYDVYVSKSVTEMVKRVLEGSAPSGIYKITRLKTGEVYIGKSTNVKDRWVQHCKTVYGAGTIAHSILHTTMQKDGLEKFTFELVEEVPKDKLTEREKYWINFYGSKEYGLNERNG